MYFYKNYFKIKVNLTFINYDKIKVTFGDFNGVDAAPVILAIKFAFAVDFNVVVHDNYFFWVGEVLVLVENLGFDYVLVIDFNSHSIGHFGVSGSDLHAIGAHGNLLESKLPLSSSG